MRVVLRRIGRATRWVALVTAALLAAIAPAAARDDATRVATNLVAAPNVLVIVTDDQRKGTMVAMPKTLQWLRSGGVEFRKAYVTTPSCCPSRASIFSGRYVHNNGVTRQRLGGNLDHRSTLQRELKTGGYFTAMAGKFLNRWNLGTRPPYFHRYAVLNGGYFDAAWGIDGVVRKVPGYTTTLIGDKAVEYLSAFEQANDARPWLLYLAPVAPHYPYRAEPKYADATFGHWPGNAAVNENVSDKPGYLRWRGPIPESTIQEIRTAQLRTLMSVDDMVNRVLRTLRAQGELRKTLVIYLSDNGYMWGEHRLVHTKFVPFTESVRVPFFARWPGHLAPGTSDRRLVANIDVKPTVLDAAGFASDPAYPMDGRSLLGAGRRGRLLTEYFFDEANAPNIQTWAAIRTATYQYVENYNQPELNGGTFREYYDLTTDPRMLTNLYSDGNANNDPPVGPLSSALAAARECSGADCR